MEDFEAIVSPFMIQARRQQNHNKLQHLELTDIEKADLIVFAQSSGYQVLLKVMEGEIMKSETEHFRQWKDPIQFSHTGLVAVAQRLFFEHLQQEVTHHFDENQGDIERAQFEEAVSKMTPSEILKNSI